MNILAQTEAVPTVETPAQPSRVDELIENLRNSLTGGNKHYDENLMRTVTGALRDPLETSEPAEIEDRVRRLREHEKKITPDDHPLISIAISKTIQYLLADE